MHIENRTFIISGGASGLGLATVRDLHSHGGYIAILDMNADLGAKAVSSLGKDRVRFFETNITDTAAIEAAVKGTADWIKETKAPIGGVIPAAGVGSPAKLIGKGNVPVEMKQLDFVLNINLRGVLDLLRLCLPHMASNEPTEPDGERGVLVLVSSSAAFDGQPGQVAYAASKGAIRSMTLVLARDLAQNGIRCMAIAPSFFDSPMTAQMSDKVRKSLEKVFEFPKRPGQAPEFASCVRHCIENAMLNGEVIRLDGASRMPSRL
jgi:3-hydroxyacyl-CoA dehydrogenase / 3-hydroxy-2-methylbutyryl-CoA dehydrogenase